MRLSEELLRTHLQGNMQVLRHHMYEYQKGLRHLILHTTSACLEGEVVCILKKYDMNYLIQPSSDQKINVFFGDQRCIDVLRGMGGKKLSDFTDEEDFILGTMLGYDRLQQCERYLERKYRKDIIVKGDIMSKNVEGRRKKGTKNARIVQNCDDDADYMPILQGIINTRCNYDGGKIEGLLEH